MGRQPIFKLVLVAGTLLLASVPGVAHEPLSVKEQDEWHSRAVERGAQLAKAAVQYVEDVEMGLGKSGILVAEGDSWFNYPGADVLDRLRRAHGYDIESVARAGDTLEKIVYGGDDLGRLGSRMEAIQRRGQAENVRAILLSAGGNDFAGPELVMLFNHKESGLAPIDGVVVEELIHRRIRTAMVSFVVAVADLRDRYFEESEAPILFHGYSCPVPDGRGFWGGFWFLPGPWLSPAFERKGYLADGEGLDQSTELICAIVDEFNKMAGSVAEDLSERKVRYVRVKDALSNELEDEAYRESWRDEMHATRDGASAVAALFAAAVED